jgi:dipeptidyl aminopeptidase/acylaminoacyl peptidase
MLIGPPAAVCVALLLTPAPGRTQNGERPRPISAARAQNNARRFELNATTLTVFDRQGKAVATVGPRALYSDMALSPDGNRLAVVKPDLENRSSDIWILDVATGEGARLTFSQRRERATQPVWSPDGIHLAFVGLRSGNFGIYRKASNGQGAEELLYQSPGTPGLADWSMDGRFLSFFSSTPFGAADLSGGILSVLPLDGVDRKPVEVYRTPKGKTLSGGWFSPDSRFLTYVSNESGRNELYVRRRDAACPLKAPRAAASGARMARNSTTSLRIRE